MKSVECCHTRQKIQSVIMYCCRVRRVNTKKKNLPGNTVIIVATEPKTILSIRGENMIDNNQFKIENPNERTNERTNERGRIVFLNNPALSKMSLSS